ncbi:fimbria/pilus periplasmic chaperone [Thalassotalea ganghwensis]
MMIRNRLYNILIFSTAFCTLIFSTYLQANVGISTYRLYLDPAHDNEDFIVTNKLDRPQKCSLGFLHYQYDESGNINDMPLKTTPENSASKLVRLSPKHFTIEAKQRQTVRFTLRRKKDTLPVEHRAFVTVNCIPQKTAAEENATKSDKNLARFKLSPQLVHNIPLVIRPKRLQASVKFEDVRIENETLFFNLVRSGERSVYGKIKLLDKNTSEILKESRNLVMYPETINKSFEMKIGTNYALNDIVIQFTEPDHFSSPLDITWKQ